MGTATKNGLMAATALAALIALAGCAGPGPGGGAPGGDPVEAGPAIDLDCAGLVDLDVLSEAFAPGIESIPLTFSGAGNYYEFSQIGLAQAGALRCEWSDGGADGPERYLTMSVLPAAAEAWAQQSAAVAIYQPLPDAYGDASWHTCSDSGGYASCRIDVLAGDRWVSAVLAGLSETDAAAPVIEAALGALAEAADGDLPARGPADATCADLATDDVVGSTLGGTLELVELETPVQPVVFHAGFLEAGGTFCYWRNDLGSASALTATAALLPGGAAGWDEFWDREPSDRVDREPVSDLGDAAYVGCTVDEPCFAAARVGDDWLQVTVNDEASPDERDRALELLRLIVDAR